MPFPTRVAVPPHVLVDGLVLVLLTHVVLPASPQSLPYFSPLGVRLFHGKAYRYPEAKKVSCASVLAIQLCMCPNRRGAHNGSLVISRESGEGRPGARNSGRSRGTSSTLLNINKRSNGTRCTRAYQPKFLGEHLSACYLEPAVGAFSNTEELLFFFFRFSNSCLAAAIPRLDDERRCCFCSKARGRRQGGRVNYYDSGQRSGV